jgi:rhodanese-related sulfurtransferase
VTLSVAPPGSRGIDEILAAARVRLHRVSPSDAFALQRNGGVLVDIRPHGQRVAEGGIPGTLVVERNHLEWRFDPRSEARLPIADRYDLPVVVVCSATRRRWRRPPCRNSGCGGQPT